MTGNGLGQGLSDMWRAVLLFVPRALAFVAILVIGYVIARLLRAAVGKGLRRAGLDRAAQRGAVGRVLQTGKVDASGLCAKVAYYAVLLFILQLAFGVFGPNPVSDLLRSLIVWLPRAFVAIAIIVVVAVIANAVYDLVSSALGGLSYGRALARVAAGVIVTLGVIAALDQVQIATAVTRPLLITVLATVAGVLIVGVGGGLIRPMQRRWESWLDKVGAESAVIRDHARAYAKERDREGAVPEPAGRDPQSAGPQGAWPVGAGPGGAGPEGVGPEGAGPERAGPAGVGSVGAEPVGPAEAGRGPAADGTATAIDETVVINRDVAETAVIAGDVDQTQVIQSGEAAETQVLPVDGQPPKRRPRSSRSRRTD